VGRVSARDCSEWRGIIAMQAIGKASDEDTSGLAEHLGHCDQCRMDADEARSAAAALTLLDAEQVDRLERESKVLELPGGDGGEQRPMGARSAPAPEATATEPDRAAVLRRRRRGLVAAGAGVVAVAAAAALVAAVALGGTTPPGRTVALTGERGVVASVSLSDQSWGTRATLRESGQAAGQVLTVSMRTSSGRWWVAGSYRTTGGSGTVDVQMSCAVQSNQITNVWVSDQSGRTVLTGYVS
jgi:hypothetical protein